MGGKRHDQYQIDVDEAGATDYKTYPDHPNETRRDYKSYSQANVKGQPVPSTAPNPEAEKARKEYEERLEDKKD